MIYRKGRSLIGSTMVGMAFVLGTAIIASADPEPRPNEQDHIHVKGHVRGQDAKGVDRAEVGYEAGAGGGGAGVSCAFVQGLPAGCRCSHNHVLTGSDGAYDLKVTILGGPQCTSAIDRVTIDKTKLYIRKQGMTITPAP